MKYKPKMMESKGVAMVEIPMVMEEERGSEVGMKGLEGNL